MRTRQNERNWKREKEKTKQVSGQAHGHRVKCESDARDERCEREAAERLDGFPRSVCRPAHEAEESESERRTQCHENADKSGNGLDREQQPSMEGTCSPE